MESRSESSSEEIRETEGSEKEEIRELEEMTLQPEVVVEERGNLEEAEDVEAVFVELVDNAAEPIDPGSTKKEGKDEEEEDRIRVNVPTIDGESEGIWSKVETLDSGEEGSFFTPDTEDEEVYSVKVKFPWLMVGDENEFETDWVRVGTFATDGHGSYFMPEVEDEVLVAFDGEAPPPTDIQPVEGTGGDESLRVSGEEIRPAENEEDD